MKIFFFTPRGHKALQQNPERASSVYYSIVMWVDWRGGGGGGGVLNWCELEKDEQVNTGASNL